MLDVLVLVPSSADSAAVDEFVAGFARDVRQAAGLLSYRASVGDVMSRGAPPPYGRVVELQFDSLASWMGWVMAPERATSRAALEQVQPLIMFFEVEQAV